jgi:hypothetical protein
MSKVLVTVKRGHPTGAARARLDNGQDVNELRDEDVIVVGNAGAVIEEKQISQEMRECGLFCFEPVKGKAEESDVDKARKAAEEKQRLEQQAAQKKAAEEKAAKAAKAKAAAKKRAGR